MFGVARNSDQRAFSENAGSLSEAGEKRKGEALRGIAEAPVKTEWGQPDSHDSIQTAEPDKEARKAGAKARIKVKARSAFSSVTGRCQNGYQR